MKSTKKRDKLLFAGMWGAALAIMVMFISCASMPGGSSLRSQPSVLLSQVNGNSVKTSKLTKTVVFGVFGGDYPSVAETAKKESITKIATVEYFTRVWFLGICINYITVVTGE